MSVSESKRWQERESVHIIKQTEKHLINLKETRGIRDLMK